LLIGAKRMFVFSSNMQYVPDGFEISRVFAYTF